LENGSQAHDRQHGEQTEAHAHADLAGRHDDEREEQADVEHRVDHEQVAPAVAAEVDAIRQRGDGGEVDAQTYQDVAPLQRRDGREDAHAVDLQVGCDGGIVRLFSPTGVRRA
jgi:hypothetical protein